jgi:RNA-directed DNA polymerase
VRKKYFASIGDRNWVFGSTVNKAGERYWKDCIRSRVHHPEAQEGAGGLQPFDPAQEMYGETLRQERMAESMAYRKQWAKLFMSQRGLCAVSQRDKQRDRVA